MDEIIIEEKKYVSSKQAAKITGYAKDYVGQLCREGRVPARLVGRGWYVLESAIQDHRFGTKDFVSDVKEPEEISSPNDKFESGSWGHSRYEAVQAEEFPSLNRLQSEEYSEAGEKPDHAQDIHESWREWFDHVASAKPHGEEVIPDSSDVRATAEDEAHQAEEKEIPIRIMGQSMPSREFLPAAEEWAASVLPARELKKTRGLNVGSVIKVAVVLVTLISVSLSLVGSGRFDDYLISHNQAGVLTGIFIYNK